MKFQVIRQVNGKFESQCFEDETALLDSMRDLGFQFLGHSERTDLLPHLQGRPVFKEFHGPMGGSIDGAPAVRYEDWEVSELLST